MSQLALPLQLADHAVFASFYSRGNETLIATLKRIAVSGSGGHGCWLWGAATNGKTHLLQAVCESAGDRSSYVPLRMFADSGPEVLEGLECRELICIDDIDSVLGKADWEVALFDLCHRILDSGSQLLVAAASSPRESHFVLADLASRLSNLVVFQLRSLPEDERVAALQLRSRHRGLELPGDTARYLLTRSRRDMASLYAVLDRLDKEALRAKRRLTVPFARSVLEGGNG